MAFNTAYGCLNENGRQTQVTYDGYNSMINMTALISALVVAPICHVISYSIFSSMVNYMRKFEEQKQLMIENGVH